MLRRIAAVITILLGAVLSGRTSVLGILGQAIMLAALIGSFYLSPQRPTRCRIPGFRRHG